MFFLKIIFVVLLSDSLRIYILMFMSGGGRIFPLNVGLAVFNSFPYAFSFNYLFILVWFP